MAPRRGTRGAAAAGGAEAAASGPFVIRCSREAKVIQWDDETFTGAPACLRTAPATATPPAPQLLSVADGRIATPFGPLAQQNADCYGSEVDETADGVAEAVRRGCRTWLHSKDGKGGGKGGGDGGRQVVAFSSLEAANAKAAWCGRPSRWARGPRLLPWCVMREPYQHAPLPLGSSMADLAPRPDRPAPPRLSSRPAAAARPERLAASARHRAARAPRLLLQRSGRVHQ